jgi:hypothetical protein
MKPTYSQKPNNIVRWRFPNGLIGRQILVAIWRWM